MTIGAAARGDAAAARRWLLLREFRTATRFTRPGADATRGRRPARQGALAPAPRAMAVAKDLLDAYQARLRELLGDADARARARASPSGAPRPPPRPPATGDILAARYREDRGEAAAGARRRARSPRCAPRRDAATRPPSPPPAPDRPGARGFTAAPFTAAESARRAQQLLRFLKLVPVEYGRGVKDGGSRRTSRSRRRSPSRPRADAAFADLADQLAKRDAGAHGAPSGRSTGSATLLEGAAAQPTGWPRTTRSRRSPSEHRGRLEAAMPAAWKKSTDESDYDLIALTLDRMEAAAGAGQHRQAEQARLEAYAFFEFGPERRLKAFDPGLALEVEGLIWFGAGPRRARQADQPGARRGASCARPACVLDERLADAAATLGDSASRTTVVTNAAIIVFREGLEAVLILAAITASFVGAERRLRRPVLVGAVLGLLGLRRDLGARPDDAAVAGAVRREARGGGGADRDRGAAADHQLVLPPRLLERVDRALPPPAAQAAREVEQAGFWSAQALGLAVLGLTSVYREGFETVLFLQSLELSAGATAVLEGAGARPRAHARAWPWSRSRSSASSPTRGCWSSPAC